MDMDKDRIKDEKEQTGPENATDAKQDLKSDTTKEQDPLKETTDKFESTQSDPTKADTSKS